MTRELFYETAVTDTAVQEQYRETHHQMYGTERPHARRASCHLSGAETMSGAVYLGPCPIAYVTRYGFSDYHLTRGGGHIDTHLGSLAECVAAAVEYIGRYCTGGWTFDTNRDAA
jgi:hypothetical protein